MRAVRADWEDRRRRKVVEKILPESQLGRPFAVLGAKRLAVKAPGEDGALALARATEYVAGRDPAVRRLGNGETKSRVRLPRADSPGRIGCRALDRLGEVPASVCPPGTVQ